MPKWCYWISPSQDPAVYGGYVPSKVVEGEPGHHPLVGDPEKHQGPWVWGRTLGEARDRAKDANREMGVMPSDALDIVASSMRAAS